MKKQIAALTIIMIPALSFAKVADFNSMIAENLKQQNELHQEVKQHVTDANVKSRERIVIVERNSDTINAPTKRGMLAFKKEKTFHRASESQKFERVAGEVSDAGQ